LQWRTVSIVEELEHLEAELGYLVPTKPKTTSAANEASTVSDPPSLPASPAHLHQNKYWGSFFLANPADSEDQETPLRSSRQRPAWTFWAYEMLQNSDMYVPSVERAATFGAHHKFSWRQLHTQPTVNVPRALSKSSSGVKAEEAKGKEQFQQRLVAALESKPHIN